jgi:hypothetical protein
VRRRRIKNFRLYPCIREIGGHIGGTMFQAREKVWRKRYEVFEKSLKFEAKLADIIRDNFAD